MNKRWLMAAMGTVLCAATLRAEEPAVKKTETETPKVSEPDKNLENKGQEKQVSKLASKYNVTEAQIRSMRTDGKGMGWGEIGHALAISQKAGVPLADVLKLRESGMGWGEIAKKYNFKLGDVTGKAKDIEKEGKKAEKADDKAKKGAEKAAAKSGNSAAGRANGSNSGGNGHSGGTHGNGRNK